MNSVAVGFALVVGLSNARCIVSDVLYQCCSTTIKPELRSDKSVVQHKIARAKTTVNCCFHPFHQRVDVVLLRFCEIRVDAKGRLEEDIVVVVVVVVSAFPSHPSLIVMEELLQGVISLR